MQASIIKIGNSQGIILPKHLLEKYKLTGRVEITETEQGLMVSTKREPREGWAEQLDASGIPADKAEMISGANAFDHTEWEW